MTTRAPHDVGGQPAGPIDTTDHGMLFWERQANALRRVARSAGLYGHDEMRRATEDLGGDYHRLSYFERSSSALRDLMLEKGIVTPSELAAKIEEVRKRYERDLAGSQTTDADQ
jgi:hypothetical protein